MKKLLIVIGITLLFTSLAVVGLARRELSEVEIRESWVKSSARATATPLVLNSSTWIDEEVIGLVKARLDYTEITNYADEHDIKATPTPHFEYDQSTMSNSATTSRRENDALKERMPQLQRPTARVNIRSGCSGALGSTGSLDIGLILVLSVCPLLISRTKKCCD